MTIQRQFKYMDTAKLFFALLLCLLGGFENVESLDSEFIQMIDSTAGYEAHVEPTSMLKIPLRGPIGPTMTASANVSARTKVETLSKVFKMSVQRIKHKQKRMDIVFLIDSSSSVGKNNFHSELKFVKKFLSDFNVSFNHTRVAIVTFSSQGKIVRHVDHISKGDEENDKCRLLNYEMPKINFSGGGTFTAGALIEAKIIMAKGRKHSRKLVCLITDGFSNGMNPVPIAQELKAENITILTIGIQSGNSAELYNISSAPGEDHSFLLESFSQFESLARRALHNDYKLGTSLRIKDSTLCDVLCDKPADATNQTASCCDPNAECSCSTLSGHYSCVCHSGFYGEGLVGKCEFCPNGTYWHSWNLCKPCPDANHVIMDMPALNISYCKCKSGFKAKGQDQCEILTCPALEPPENGYFVEHPSGCGHVLNTACGARCKPGYQLLGSSIRLCQENGTWSGTETKCVLKTCPSLSIPFYGMVVCKNSDLNLYLDYTPRNETFMELYDREEFRITEPMPSDTDCTFKCGPGFFMVGSTKRNCLPLSKWDGLQTGCKQILCQPLPEVNFGHYEPTDCAEQKMAHSTNCTLVCDEGFEARGPAIKTCNGKRTGVWSNRNKYPKCIDVTPPTLDCPGNFSVNMSEDDNFAIVKFFPQPNVTDNSGGNITYWIKPAVKNEGVKLTIGDHTFTYVAVDNFKNKARCNFTVTVLDTTPPVMDNCIDPPEIKIPLLPFIDRNLTFVDWDPPIIYDNSNTELHVSQSLQPGFLGIGIHQVTYHAKDPSGNRNSCVMNITVKPLQCDALPSPANGQSLCAKNLTHTWCEVTCDVGYAIFDELAENHLENFKLFCVNEFARWQYDILPDCTQLELPESIEQVFSITLDSESPICSDDSLTMLEIQEEFRAQIRAQLCEGVEECEIASEVPDCSVVHNTNSTTMPSTNELTNKTFYHVVKREIRNNRRNSTSNGAKQMNMKIRVYTRISKKLGIWDPKIPRSENLKRVKAELRTFHTDKELRDKLEKLRINVRHLNLDELTLCRNGSVSKKGACIQCPRGSYHNAALNICQLCPLGYYNNKTGRTECFGCPEHFSTRKLGSRYPSECIEQCPPGTIAKVKVRAVQKLQNSLMPFCRKCPPGQYQSQYNQIKCDNCGSNQMSPRGSVSASACYPKQGHPCFSQPGVCGPHGVCQQENGNSYLYSCLCQEEFIGSHCELQIDLCASAPCQNGGTCNQINSTSFACKCDGRFQGDTCESAVDACKDNSCRNGGTCVDAEGTVVCECAPGYEGVSCENQHNFCTTNPCEAGQCLNTPEGYICKCPKGVIGRRCHLRPCDYLPCHKNSVCLDLQVFPASRNSFVCRCPNGLKGFDCAQIDSPCDAEPCRNNGACIPLALRNTTQTDEIIDDSLYSQYRCKCAPYFYGKNCEVLTTPDFVMEFSKSGVQNFIEAAGPAHSLKEISLCTWLQTNDSFNYGTILSYASESSDNMFTLTDYNGFVLYVSGNNIITDIQINDGQWHFICLSWSSEGGVYEIYVDGELRDTGFNLSPGSLIESNGILIVGQEQDSPGTSFSETESFVGRIAYLDIWRRFLSPDEILEYYTTCEPYQGDLYLWSDFKNKIKGNVKITTSPFCKPCLQKLRLLNGYIRYMGNSAFHFCYDGYRLQGSPRRDCLRTSQWSPQVPFCRSINCGQLPNLANGVISIQKTISGEEATFTCHDNYYLVGSKTRVCLSNGTWSGIDAECISTIECDRIASPLHSHLVYANETGRISNELLKYPMGTYIEIQCINDTVPVGENFLTCTESGAWDFPAPQCAKEDANLERKLIETTARRTPLPTTMSSRFADVEMPDKEFWMNLRRFFYYGCSATIEKNKRSELCEQLTMPNNFTDLTNYETPDSDDFKNMDFKLVSYLKKAASLTANQSISDKLNFENLFGFIIYGNLTQRQVSLADLKQSSSIETSIRLVLCFYIDTILLDSDLHISTSTDDPKKFENITQNIKSYLVEIVSVVYQNFRAKSTGDDLYSTSTKANTRDGRRTRSAFHYVEDDSEDDYDAYVDLDGLHSDVTYDYEDLKMDITTKASKEMSSTVSIQQSSSEAISTGMQTTTTQNHSENGCNLGILFVTYTNIVIANITMGKVTSNIEKAQIVPLETTVVLGCAQGFIAKGVNVTICERKSTWSQIDLSCSRVTCGAPLKPYEMTMNTVTSTNAKYFVGSKLQLKCNSGYQLIGSPFIYCMPSGKWSGVMSHCSKRNCATPSLAANITIVESHRARMLVKCPRNEASVEITCQSNGKWNPSESELCSI